MTHVDKLRVSYSSGVTIVLTVDDVEVDRAVFEASLKGNGEQFKYIKAHTIKGSNHKFYRL